MAVAELDNQLQQMLINDNINLQLEANAIEEEEPEEEPSEIQGQSGLLLGSLTNPDTLMEPMWCQQMSCLMKKVP